MRSHVLLIPLLGLAVSCAHRPALKPELRSLLALEPQFSVLRGAALSPIAFTLRNTSADPIDFCLVDSNVSLWLKAHNGQMRPLVLHGATSGPGCSRRLRLSPGAGTQFQQQVTVPTGWHSPGNSAVLGALIRVEWPHELQYTPEAEGTIRTPEFTVLFQP